MHIVGAWLKAAHGTFPSIDWARGMSLMKETYAATKLSFQLFLCFSQNP